MSVSIFNGHWFLVDFLFFICLSFVFHYWCCLAPPFTCSLAGSSRSIILRLRLLCNGSKGSNHCIVCVRWNKQNENSILLIWPNFSASTFAHNGSRYFQQKLLDEMTKRRWKGTKGNQLHDKNPMKENTTTTTPERRTERKYINSCTLCAYCGNVNKTCDCFSLCVTVESCERTCKTLNDCLDGEFESDAQLKK